MPRVRFNQNWSFTFHKLPGQPTIAYKANTVALVKEDIAAEAVAIGVAAYLTDQPPAAEAEPRAPAPRPRRRRKL